MIHKVDISHKTIFFITGFLIALWITFLIKDILLMLFVAVILVSALSPVVNFLSRFKVPKPLSIAITYIIIIGVFTGVIALIMPTLIEQTSKLIVNLPEFLAKAFDIANVDRSVVQSELSNLSRNAFSLTLAIFDNILTIIFLLVITFYLLLEKDNIESRVSLLFVGREERVKRLISEIQEKLGAWLRGQFILSLIIGSITYLGLILFNIPYALPLAILAGILEVVPTIGPIISSVPAIILAYTISPVWALGVGAMYFVIQQLENHLIVPQVMKRAVGLNPLVVILAIAIGGRLLGFVGALLAVPIAVVLQVIITEVIASRK